MGDVPTVRKMMVGKTSERVRQSLRYSVLDGSFYAVMVGCGEIFLPAFAVFMKATSLQLGLLGSLPQMLGSLLQLSSNRLLGLFGSRKRFVCTGALLQALMYVPIALAFYLGAHRIHYLIAFICLYWCFGMILNPAWSSWIGDLVDERVRGTYFGSRNRIIGFLTFATSLLAGYLLRLFSDGETTQFTGFASIFSLALTARIVSFLFLTKKYEPEYEIEEGGESGLIEFVKQVRSSNYGLFIMYLCVMNFAVFMSGPFFTPYMLRDLRFDYWTYTVVIASALIVKFLTMPVWGELLDRYGTKRVLAVSGFLMPVLPALWLFRADVWYLIIVQFMGGLLWAGFEISTFNFIFDTTSPRKRVTFISNYNVLNGIAIFLGALTGSMIVKYNNVFESKYFLVFLLSFVIRLIASIVFIPRLKEVRDVEHISYHRLLLKIVATIPTRGLVFAPIPFRKK